MRQTIKGLVAAVAVVTASAAPAMACGGGGLFSALSSCSPCQSYNPCGGSYNSGYYGGGYAASYQRLPDPVQQYYYVNQGPVYSGPASFAPAPTYQESGYATASRYDDEGPAAYGYRARPQYRAWRPRTGYYHAPRMNHRYGYAPRHSYAPRYSLPPRQYTPHHSMRYGHRYSTPSHYGHRQSVLRRYY